MIVHVDANSFFASCEASFQPAARGKPIVVLASHEGAIVARSKEAKALGIPDLEPYFKVKSLLDKNKVLVFSSNFPLYADISSRVMDTLQTFSDNHLEIYSIDECFLLLNGILENPVDLGNRIKSTVWKHVRIPVSVGISETKSLAKLANRTAKTMEHCQGVCVLDTPKKWEWVLARTPIKKLWGISDRLETRLHALNITTGLQLARADPKWIRRYTSINIEKMIFELNGIPALSLDETPPPKKQIFYTRSFGEKLNKLEPILHAVAAYAARSAEKLRAQSHLVASIYVFLHTSPFAPGYYYNALTIRLPAPTDDSRTIISAAKGAIERMYRSNLEFVKCGVGLVDLIDRRFMQYDMLQPLPSNRSKALMQCVDNVNKRMGKNTLFYAAQGIQKPWHRFHHQRSREFTTRWNDIPIVS